MLARKLVTGKISVIRWLLLNIYIIKGRECRKFRGECGMVLKCPLKHWVEEFGHEF